MADILAKKCNLSLDSSGNLQEIQATKGILKDNEGMMPGKSAWRGSIGK
jgi:hypothetical protein